MYIRQIVITPRQQSDTGKPVQKNPPFTLIRLIKYWTQLTKIEMLKQDQGFCLSQRSQGETEPEMGAQSAFLAQNFNFFEVVSGSFLAVLHKRVSRHRSLWITMSSELLQTGEGMDLVPLSSRSVSDASQQSSTNEALRRRFPEIVSHDEFLVSGES